jgi:hypothetical protein
VSHLAVRRAGPPTPRRSAGCSTRSTEFDEPTPGPRALAERVRELLGAGELIAVVGGTGPDGVAVLRFRRSVWTDGLECYHAGILGDEGEERTRAAYAGATWERLAALGPPHGD